jgi:hypothetical protein
MKVQRTATLVRRETPKTKDVKPSVLSASKGRNPGGTDKGALNSTGEQDTLELWGDPNMEDVVTRENMSRALKRVKRNKGAAGIDGMPVEEARKFVERGRRWVVKNGGWNYPQEIGKEINRL